MRSTYLLTCLLALVACIPIEQPSTLTKETQRETIGKNGTGYETMMSSGHLLSNGILEFGNQDAPVSLLLFTNHRCRYCREFQRKHFPDLQRTFVASGSLKIAIVEFPLQKYGTSPLAHATLYCAGRLNQGPQTMKTIFGDNWYDEKSLLKELQEKGIPKETLETCIKEEATHDVQKQHQAWARNLNVQYVPTYFINGEMQIGLPELADLRSHIESMLREQRP